MVASSYLMPAETLYVVRVARGLDRLKRPARPAKHTRQTYIHEAFPLPLYQTRKVVICFAPFQQCDFDSLSPLSIDCNQIAYTTPHCCIGTQTRGPILGRQE